MLFVLFFLIVTNEILAEVKGLNGEMNALIKTHQEELNILQKTLSSKQKTISESESNLTAIGTYVDKLEDRLTSFAVTRRDMEERRKAVQRNRGGCSGR